MTHSTPETNREKIVGKKKIIRNLERRLQLLEEQRAKLGINTPPEISIEIQDTKPEIEQRQVELKELEKQAFVTEVFEIIDQDNKDELRQFAETLLEQRMSARSKDLDPRILKMGPSPKMILGVTLDTIDENNRRLKEKINSLPGIDRGK